jgi:hypothetical protein
MKSRNNRLKRRKCKRGGAGTRRLGKSEKQSREEAEAYLNSVRIQGSQPKPLTERMTKGLLKRLRHIGLSTEKGETTRIFNKFYSRMGEAVDADDMEKAIEIEDELNKWYNPIRKRIEAENAKIRERNSIRRSNQQLKDEDENTRRYNKDHLSERPGSLMHQKGPFSR